MGRDTVQNPPRAATHGSAAIPWASGGQVLRALGRKAARYPWRTTGAVLALLASAGCGLVLPSVLGAFVDLGTGQGGAHWLIGNGGLIWAVAVLLGSVILGASLNAVGTVWSAGVADRVIASLREDTMAAALSRGQEEAEAAGSGEVVSRSTDDVAAVTSAINTALPSAVAAVTGILVTAVGMVAIHWSYAVSLMVVTVPVYGFVVRRYLREAPPLYATERSQRARRAGVVLDVVKGSTQIRTYDAAGFMRTRLVRPSWVVARMIVLTQIATTRLFAGVNLAEFLGMVALLGTTLVLLGQGAVTLGAATAAILFFMRLYDPIGTALMMLDKLQSAATSLSRIVGMMGSTANAGNVRTSVVVDGAAEAGLADTRTGGSELRVTGLRAGYGDQAVVHDVSFTVPAGTSLALVGASGAGKTTVAAVAAGVRDPLTGTVEVGPGLTGSTQTGMELLHELPAADRARRVALIAQEGHVFSTTLRGNLDLGRPGCSDEQLWEALQLVGLGEWARELPDGLDTTLEAGSPMVAEHRSQQLALARAAVLDPAVVILDEPSSRVSEHEAAELGEAVAGLSRGRTSVVIAHRLVQASVCDRILVMDRGRVVEDGTHDQLLRCGGRYAALWDASQIG
ncbi:ABC transporter ATP-binding protein [Kocuria sp.]|uniref:ABC transporter ATP-binding protein n=1 Tax=Kocuria sp. TaxID=1871328 RepID=UPI0026DF6CA3|nr:ABC transporter ATP-binding protein [Kocuria sp.]MDO5618417.1 ABC transporter ATP-binding protein [Kocuria sp.]